MERKRQEIIEAEAEVERQKAEQRRQRIEIVHESPEPDRKLIVSHQGPPLDQNVTPEKSIIDYTSMPTEWSPEAIDFHDQSVQKQQTPESYSNLPITAEQVAPDAQDYREQNEETSIVSGDAMNPQGEDELVVQENRQTQLQILLEESKMERETQNVLEQELQMQTKGGVNAVGRQQELMIRKRDSELYQLQAQNVERARKRDNILAHNDMLPAREEEKKNQKKLGPSTIRTLIRAAESRTQL